MTELTRSRIEEIRTTAPRMTEGEIAALCDLALEALEMRNGQMFDMGGGRYLCSGGRWHGWEFRKHPDGQFVSVGQRHYEKPISSLPKVNHDTETE